MSADPPYIPPRPLRRPASSPSGRRNLWWRELTVGLLSGTVVAAGSLYSQNLVDDQRSERETVIAQRMADEADRRENLRFVRDRSSDETSAKPFSDMDLTGQSLRGLKLNKSDFSGATLGQTYFDGSSLIEGTFVNSTLVKASFDGADLTGAKIHFSTATDAHFSRANLTNADVSFTSFANADFRGAELAGSHIYQADMVDIDLREANLTGAQLRADLTGADFSGADLRGADLTGSVLQATTWKSVVDGQVFSTSGEVSTEVTLIVCADASTLWPEGFIPPETKADGCDTDSTQSFMEAARKLVRQ